MFTNENDLLINGINIAPYLTSIKYTFSKVWGDDTGRNTLDGEFSGTYKGLNTKITPIFKKNLTPKELEIIIPLLDDVMPNVTYRNPRTQELRTFISYSGDYEITYTGTKRNSGTQISYIDRKLI